MDTSPKEIVHVEKIDQDAGSPNSKGFEKEAFDPQKADQFQAALENKQATTAQPANLIDLSAQKPQVATTNDTLDAIQLTSQAIKTRIEEIKQVLSAPDSKIKDSYKNLLENKLSHIDDALRIALEKTGAEDTVASGALSFGTGVEKFLGFLTRSQHRMNSVLDEINNIKFNKGNEVRPADLLAVQVKVNFMQQELELFTNLLNKGLESTKTLLNVQV